jgi:hypothetical protein
MKITIKKAAVQEDLMMGLTKAPEEHDMQDHGEYEKDPDGYEGEMAKTNLYKIADYAKDLCALLRDDENLEPWVQEKIAVAASMIDSVAHHLKYQKRR